MSWAAAVLQVKAVNNNTRKHTLENLHIFATS